MLLVTVPMYSSSCVVFVELSTRVKGEDVAWKALGVRGDVWMVLLLPRNRLRVDFGDTHSGLVCVSVCTAYVDSGRGGCGGYGLEVASRLSSSAVVVWCRG